MELRRLLLAMLPCTCATPMQMIQATNMEAAQFLGESKNLGTLEGGRRVDLIVPGRNTRSIEQVYIGGNRL